MRTHREGRLTSRRAEPCSQHKGVNGVSSHLEPRAPHVFFFSFFVKNSKDQQVQYAKRTNNRLGLTRPLPFLSKS